MGEYELEELGDILLNIPEGQNLKNLESVRVKDLSNKTEGKRGKYKLHYQYIAISYMFYFQIILLYLFILFTKSVLTN
ncbi:hypothetical protein HMPREF9456_00194 [Dysgonomonas mossii DSM 22836]|uniref:Uncharacterized protein n=1 Tax=Dysgonomonas mossii DSM 22836 TaxID=742767 RepID=F8WWI6_9BACT|nr:hypothetical protein HMPREF9456_00194 [Dysgonomonas mossii DSM 22836]